MDLTTSIDGDIAVENGTVRQLSLGEYVGQRVLHILRSKPGDWKYDSGKGAYIAQYVGYPNIPSVGKMIESEVRDQLYRDQIVGQFDISVYYTPIASNAGVIEVQVTLFDGQVVQLNTKLQTDAAIFTQEGPQFTSPTYGNQEIIRTEVIYLDEATNQIPIQYLPINSNVIVVRPDDPRVNSNGFIDIQTAFIEQNFVLDPEQMASGVLTSGQLTEWTFLLNSDVYDTMVNKLVISKEVLVDGTLLNDKDYVFGEDSLNFREAWYEQIGTESIKHGLDNPPSGTVDVKIYYYDVDPVIGIAEEDNITSPSRIFPRSRIMTKYTAIMAKIFDIGQYIVQYVSRNVVGA